ncbi:restriction endonuclease [Paenibacillus koleovorans]|uniref:restriction endonuclease n=1 Tax=Paenibacillus koleovorans TaxID=121608 RepID=UPI000FDA96E8|nr:restriction endonuclease [Paenibacillus koleovorans]
MARRRRKKKEVDLAEGLVGFGLLGSFYLSYQATGSFQAAVFITSVLLGVAIAIFVWMYMERVEKLKRSGIADIDKMDGRQFELYLGHLFRAYGYEVKVTRAAGDFGADLVVSKAEKKIVVQAKRHAQNVGISAVQEVHGSKSHYSATEAWVITNSDFTDAARELARSTGVRLINRGELVEMILKLNPKGTPAKASTPKQVMEAEPIKTKTCSRCGSAMVLRKSTRGEFYGCSSFPKCRNNIQA